MSLHQVQGEPSPRRKQGKKHRYIPIKNKFWISHGFAFLWLCLSVWLSIPWVLDLGGITGIFLAVLIVAGISYIPGFMNAFMTSSLLLDRQPPRKVQFPLEPVTILIAARNEEDGIGEAIRYIAAQDYGGKLSVLVIDNNSSDRTAEAALQAGKEHQVEVSVLREPTPGKSHALNAALPHVETELFLTLDADTLLHRSAVRLIVSRLLSAPADVCAVAGAVLVRNSRKNLLTKVQEWDYFLGIASIKRLQGLFQGTLVAQGAFSLYRTEAVRKIGGWPDAIGEDIVLTWRFLGENWRVYFEPLAVAFTCVPEKFSHFVRQRSRWARGMIEALRIIKPWQQPIPYVQYMTGCNLIMPYLDITFTLAWIPGLILAFFGHYWIVGPFTLFVLPLTILQNCILYRYQRRVFQTLDLCVRKNRLGFWLYVLCYQMVLSPVSVYGYLQELLHLRRKWK